MPKDKDKTIYTTTKTFVDYETGEVTKQEETTHIKKSAEPNYVKLYITTLLAFKELPKSLNPILIEFLSYMSYADTSEKNGGQKIYVNIDMKRDIANKLNLSVESVNKGLFQLVRSGMFKRIGTGTYQVNPFMFGKGEWKDISAIRATFDYNTGEIIADIKTKEDEASE